MSSPLSNSTSIESSIMWWTSHLNLYLLWLICNTSQLVIPGVRGEGEFSENKLFTKFVQAIDPTNVLLTKWNGSMLEHCSDKWRGVKCDLKTHTITEIRLESSNLCGVLDTDSLCKLPSLQVLDLAKNHIVGTIPDSISNCTSLTHLNLSNNLLFGMVPPSLSELKNLRNLDISKNNFFSEHANIIVKEVIQGTFANFIKYKADAPAPLRGGADSPQHHRSIFTPNWIIVLLCITSLSCFLFFVSKKSPNTMRKTEIQRSLEDSSIKISAVKAGEETKQGEDRSELLFFVEERERFQIEDLLESAADLQGQSLCSSLYKVRLRNNAVYAVKRLKKLEISFEEFRHTMKQIGSLKHPNISSLIAYYSSKEEKLLIYKYQWKGSLLALLESYAEGKRDFPWRHRLSIANGIAQGLDFIHQRPCSGKSIPHGNLKLSNILLTENEEPLISEFGFQRFLDPKKASLYSSNGYKAPEKHLTEQADVFSFGVILLELLTGKTVEKSGIDLPKWVKAMVREEWTGEVFDKEVNKAGKQWAFPLLNIALKCVSHNPENRPNISEVRDKIEEAANDQEDFSFSSTSSVESNQQDGCLLHTVIPEIWETPGSNN